MKTLKISDSLDLPIQGERGAPGAITQKYSFLGRTGSGKTYGGSKLAELMLEAGAQIIALDPVGVWPFLRIGERPFSLPVLGGLYGDVPLEPTGGALVADFLVDTGSSAVLDVSQMIDAEQLRFATGFATRFFDRKKAAPSAVHLFIEEAQEFLPQNIEGRGGGVAHAINAFNRIVKIGRNFGIGVSLITQRPQEVSKKALNQTECLFAFQMTGVQERKAIAAWCADKGLDVNLVEALPKLAVGNAYAWSPQWLGVAKEIRIAKKRTADGSSAPTVGGGSRFKLSPVDLPALRSAMTETVERAKADDPRELRKRIAELEKELRAKPAAAAERIEVRVPFFDSGAYGIMFEKILDQLGHIGRVTQEARDEIGDRLKAYQDAAQAAAALGEKGIPRAALHAPPGNWDEKKVRSFNAYEPPPRPIAHRDPKPANGASEVGAGALRQLMIALAQRPQGLTRRQIACRAAISVDSSTFRNNVAHAKQQDWLETDGEIFRITERGRGALGAFEPLPEGRELLEYWFREFGDSAHAKAFRAIAEAYPRDLSREEIGERAGVSIGSSTFRNGMARLKHLELIEGKNRFRLSEELGG